MSPLSNILNTGTDKDLEKWIRKNSLNDHFVVDFARACKRQEQVSIFVSYLSKGEIDTLIHCSIVYNKCFILDNSTLKRRCCPRVRSLWMNSLSMIPSDKYIIKLMNLGYSFEKVSRNCRPDILICSSEIRAVLKHSEKYRAAISHLEYLNEESIQLVSMFLRS